jgi:hypothetical protein
MTATFKDEIKEEIVRHILQTTANTRQAIWVFGFNLTWFCIWKIRQIRMGLI